MMAHIEVTGDLIEGGEVNIAGEGRKGGSEGDEEG